MFYGNLAQLGKKSNSVIRSRSVMVKNLLFQNNWYHFEADEVERFRVHVLYCATYWNKRISI